MFNYKTWRLYYPGAGTIVPDPVVDENGNSITPNSLKKNMTIPAEAPGNDLEKVLNNMNGTDPTYPVEGGSGLIKQMNELAENPPSGGGVLTVRIDNNNMFDKTMGEIQEAWDHNDRIDIIGISGVHHAPVMLVYVHDDPKANPPAYTGNVRILDPGGDVRMYRVDEATEADALDAYPSM